MIKGPKQNVYCLQQHSKLFGRRLFKIHQQLAKERFFNHVNIFILYIPQRTDNMFRCLKHLIIYKIAKVFSNFDDNSVPELLLKTELSFRFTLNEDSSYERENQNNIFSVNNDFQTSVYVSCNETMENWVTFD